MGQVLLADALAPVQHAEHGFSVPLLHADLDFVPRRRVPHGVVQQVDEHLHDELRVHRHHQQLLRQLGVDFPVRRAPLHLRQRAADDLLHGLRLLLDLQPAILKAGQAEDVLHERVQPVRVAPDVLREPAARVVLRGQIPDHLAGAHDAGERRAQVVGDGAQQVAAGALLKALLAVSLLRPRRAQALDGHGDGFEHGAKELPLRVGKRHAGQPEHAQDALLPVERPFLPRFRLHTARAQQLHAAGDLVARMKLPVDDVPGGILQVAALRLTLLRQKEQRGVAAKGLPDAAKRRRADGLHALRVAQAVGQLVERLRVPLACQSSPRAALHLRGQRAGEDRGERHDGEGDEVAGIADLKGEARIGKEVVERERRQHGRRERVARAVRIPGDDQHRRQIHQHDVGFRKAQKGKQNPQRRCQQHHQHDLRRIHPRKTPIPHFNSFFSVFSCHSVCPIRSCVKPLRRFAAGLQSRAQRAIMCAKGAYSLVLSDWQEPDFY